MIPQLTTIVIATVTSIASGFGAWFFTKKKYYSEVDHQLISNMQESLDFYITLSNDNKRRLEEFVSLYEDLTAKTIKLVEDNKAIAEENLKISKENRVLKEELITFKERMESIVDTMCSQENCKERIINGIKASKKIPR